MLLHRRSIGDSAVLPCRHEDANQRISRLQDELDKAHKTSETAARAAEQAAARVASLERALEELDTASATAAARAAVRVASLERALQEREAASASAAAEASAEAASLKRSLREREAAAERAAAAAAAQAASLQQAMQEREAAFAGAAAQAAAQIASLQRALQDRETACAAAMGATERSWCPPALQRGMEEARPALGGLPCHAAMHLGCWAVRGGQSPRQLASPQLLPCGMSGFCRQHASCMQRTQLPEPPALFCHVSS